MEFNPKPVQSNNAPAPIGPYEQAIAAGPFLFCSGQIALDAQSGEFQGGDVVAQTRKVMENLSAVLSAGGARLDTVVKTTIYLRSMDDFPKVNQIYGEFFQNQAPARATVEVARLPKDALVEIDAIALIL